MPLVPASDTVTLKVSLPRKTADEFFAYAEWANAPRSRVMRVALERLFRDDEDWQVSLLPEPPEID